MVNPQEKLRAMLTAIGKPIGVVNIYFENHVPKMLREWADRIESGEVLVKKAVITVDFDVAPDLQNINLIIASKVK